METNEIEMDGWHAFTQLETNNGVFKLRPEIILIQTVPFSALYKRNLTSLVIQTEEIMDEGDYIWAIITKIMTSPCNFYYSDMNDPFYTKGNTFCFVL